MQGNRKAGTTPEKRVAELLRQAGAPIGNGLRIRVGAVAATPDLVSEAERIAVFVDGCFWHSCPSHGVIPRTNAHYWIPKLEANIARDRAIDEAWSRAGWIVIRIWEHDAEVAVDRYIESGGPLN